MDAAAQTFLISFLAFGAVVAAMAIGVVFAGKRIKGSCGGLSAWRDGEGRPVCDACAECPDRKPGCELAERERAAGIDGP